MSDLVLAILEGLSQEDKKEISELSFPAVGDSVWSYQRELEGWWGGGEIIEANRNEDEYLVAWWDPETGGIRKDCTIFEKYDFGYFKDGRSGRLWYTL